MSRFNDYMINKVGQTAVQPSMHDTKMIRKAMQEELQAISDYTKRAHKAENDALKEVFLEIAQEERVHFEEFEILLEAIDPDYEASEEEAEEESEEMFGPEDEEIED